MHNELRKKVESRNAKIAIWGCGFVGTTNLLYLSDIGFKCIGIDVDPKRVAELMNGIYKVNSDENTLGKITNCKPKFDVIENPCKENLGDIDIHYLCLPTEKDFKPTPEYVENVIISIGNYARKKALIIIECSMPPAWIEKCIVNVLANKGWNLNEDYLLGAAPRRDLFGELDFELKNTARVIGASNDEGRKIMRALYSSYCNSIYEAKDCQHAVLSKIVENTYRCFDISLANQLNQALGNYDITHVLELASTKWNVEKYHPSFGIGGYCVPLAPQYIMEEMENNGYNSVIFKNIMDFNDNTVKDLLCRYADVFARASRVVVLGLSSIPNVGILNCSIGCKVVDELKVQKMNIIVHDPYITSDSLKIATGCDSMESLEDINDDDIVIIVTQHDVYKDILNMNPLGCKIIDTFGLCRELRSRNDLEYYEVGCNAAINEVGSKPNKRAS